MTIKTREPGDAFKRQVSEFVPIAKKRRPWRDEEPASEDVDLSSEAKSSSVREVQGAVASDEVTIDSLRSTLEISSRAKSARDADGVIRGQSQAKIARDARDQEHVPTRAEIARVGVVEAPSPTDVNEVLSEKIFSTPAQAKIARVESGSPSVTAQAESAQDADLHSIENSDSTQLSVIVDPASREVSTRAEIARVEQERIDTEERTESPSNEDHSRSHPQAKIARAGSGKTDAQTRADFARADLAPLEAQPRAEIARVDEFKANSSQAEFARVPLAQVEIIAQANFAQDVGTQTDIESRAEIARDKVAPLEAQTRAEIAQAYESVLALAQAKTARVETEESIQISRAESARDDSFVISENADSRRSLAASPHPDDNAQSRAKSARDDVFLVPRFNDQNDSLSPHPSRLETRAEIARAAVSQVEIISRAEFARDTIHDPSELSQPQEGRGGRSSNEKIGLIASSAQLRLPSRPTGQKEKLKQPEELEPLPGTRKMRAHFVFNVALKRIDNSAAALLYCYLWHHAEELGTGRFKISVGEMSEAISVARRTLTDAIKRLTEVGLFENVNSGKTTVPDVRVLFELG